MINLNKKQSSAFLWDWWFCLYLYRLVASRFVRQAKLQRMWENDEISFNTFQFFSYRLLFLMLSVRNIFYVSLCQKNFVFLKTIVIMNKKALRKHSIFVFHIHVRVEKYPCGEKPVWTYSLRLLASQTHVFGRAFSKLRKIRLVMGNFRKMNKNFATELHIFLKWLRWPNFKNCKLWVLFKWLLTDFLWLKRNCLFQISPQFVVFSLRGL